MIAINLLDEILEQAVETSGKTEDECLNEATDSAIAEVRGYLNRKSNLYDIAAEFEKESDATDRNLNVIRAVIHIALYNLHFTINPHDIPEMRQKAYDRLVGKDGELSQVREGVLDWELPDREPEDPDDGDDSNDPIGRTEIGSARKFISKEFTDPAMQYNDNPNA